MIFLNNFYIKSCHREKECFLRRRSDPFKFKRLLRPAKAGLAMTLASLSFCLCGCNALHHLPELSTMGEYSREMDNHKKTVDAIDQHYDALAATVNTDGLKSYPDAGSVRSSFGEPILIKNIEVDGKSREQWLYRHALIAKSNDKVYLYFDKQGKLIRYEKENIQW